MCCWGFVRPFCHCLYRRRESRRGRKVCLSWAKAILYVYVRCWANISDHRGVECPATIITPYQVLMHVPFTCAHTSGVEIRGDCEQGDLRQELSSSSPRAGPVRRSVVRHECPQPTTNNWGPPCRRAEPAKKIPDERSGRGENACVPFVDVGSLLAMGRVSRASTRHDVSYPALLRQMRAPCAHSTHVTYRWSWLAHLRAGQCCYIDRCFGRAGQPWVRRDTTLSTSAASRPSVWPAWTVYCSLCLSASGAARIRTACFEDDDESPQATPHGILRRLWPPNVITAASVRVPIDARNRHTILHNAQQTCSRCISAGRNPVVAASQSRSTCAPPLCTPGPTAH